MDRSHGAAATFVAAASLATWFLMGQLSEDPGTYYMFRVPNLARSLEIAVGLAMLGLAAAAGVRLWQWEYRWLIQRGWWRVYGRLLAAGVLVPAGGRAVTAGTNGANIGGGAIFMFGPLPVLCLLEGARLEARRLRLSTRR